MRLPLESCVHATHALGVSAAATEMARYRLMPAATLRTEMALALQGEASDDVDRMPAARDWRMMPQLHKSHWLCIRCDKVMSMQQPECTVCSVALTELRGSETVGEHMRGVLANAHRTAYGRNLACLADREPVLSNGSAPAIGTPEHAAWVRRQLCDFSRRPADMRTETKPCADVCCFDAWLCLQTDAEVRFFTREHVRQFMQDATVTSAEDMVADYISDLGKVTYVPGSASPVMVHPKGGWWMAALSHITEHDLRMARAFLGLAMDTGATASSVQQAVLNGPFNTDIYGLLSALMSVIIVRQAAVERGPGGRARRSGAATPTAQLYASRGFEPPRCAAAF